MKTLITTLNSKYIHKSLSLRLLYVSTYQDYDVGFKEYTIKDSLENVAQDIVNQNIDHLVFSTYIWNVTYIKELFTLLKTKQPHLIITIGGPEVTYDIDPFLDDYPIDYLIAGEGEVALKQLLYALENHQDSDIQGISTRDKRDYRLTQDVDLSYIESLPSPYLLPQDQEDNGKRVMYFETSRGCPYQCQYCLSSLEKGLRFFSMDYLKTQLLGILQSKTKIVKLLDRSFNAKTEHALEILEFIFQHAREGIQFQFEINGDVLDQRIIDYINDYAPVGLLRFEIGIQSTYDPTNEIVKRHQDFQRLGQVIQQLYQGGKVDFHLDLIAGLPLETLERFAKSFDDVFALQPKELQLGFLKLLRGTNLRKDAQKYGIIYQDDAPYELIENHDLSSQDIAQIHLVEDMLEKYWNSGKMNNAMKTIIHDYDSPFYFFLDLGDYYDHHHYKRIGFQNDELFQCLDEFLNHRYHNELIEDYLRLSKIKPKRWYQPTLSHGQVKEVKHYLIEKYQLNQEDVFRYGLVEDLGDYYLLAIYKNYQSEVTMYKKS